MGKDKVTTMLKMCISVFLLLGVLIGCSYFGVPWMDRAEPVIIVFKDGTVVSEMVAWFSDQGLDTMFHIELIPAIVAKLTNEEREFIKLVLPVEYIEPDSEVSLLDLPRPSPMFTFPLRFPENIIADNFEVTDWGVKDIHAPEAWALATGKGVKIGVIDTGIDSTHPDLIDAVVGGYNAILDNGAWLDDQGHGTSVASVIGARKNGVGIVGVAPDCDLYSIKVLNSEGRGNISDIVRGYDYARRVLDLDDVNCSFGSYYQSRAMMEAMDAAAWQGMGTIAAGGNDGNESYGNKVIYPARNPIAICVAATDSDNERTSWSNYGDAMILNGVAAPGAAILTAKMGGGLRRVSGTSIAAPHVTGIAALMEERGWCIRRFLFEGAPLFDAPDIYVGHGRVDAWATLMVMNRAALMGNE